VTFTLPQLLTLASILIAAGAQLQMLRILSKQVAELIVGNQAEHQRMIERIATLEGKTGIRGGALDDVRIIAARQGLGADFVRLVVSIASNESQGTYALPANPPQNAATGWGVFSYNRDAWHRLGNEGTYRFFDCSAPMPGAQRQMMWEASPQEEIEGPVREYACVWRKVMTEEGDTLAAARATRLWHRAPAYTKDFIRLATAEGFNWSGAWSKLEDRAEAQKGYMLASIDRTNADMREEGFA
jgi:hypothetical protein